MPRLGRPITCACGCGRRGPHHSRGLVETCWKRHKYNNALDRYPRTTPVPPPRPMRLVSPRVAGRIEDYVELRSWGVRREEARQRLGVTDRTISRWHTHLRAHGHTHRWLIEATPDRFLTAATNQKESTAA